MTLVRFTVSVILCVFCFSASAAKIINHPKVNDSNGEYILGLLKIALAYHGQKYRLQGAPDYYSKTKQIEDIHHGEQSILWTGMSKDLEDELLPIRIPLFKGLLGHRIFIVRGDDGRLLSSIDSLEDLRRVKMGQGNTWSVVPILEGANMNLIKGPKYIGLFHMLEGGRFDAFPRGLHEPWDEIKRFDELGLIVDDNIMLVFPFALYLYVGKTDIQLARDITSGLEQSIADGSFDEYFYNHPMIRTVLAKANVTERKVFRISNPLAHHLTPLDRPELWFEVNRAY